MHKLKIEQTYFNSGHNFLVGIDEAGRGPLAGPVVAACVGMPSQYVIKNPALKLVNDSKKLSEKQRTKLFEIIIEEFPEIGIGVIDNTQIDQLNILQANFLAMRTALSKLKSVPKLILVDGNLKIPKIKYSQQTIVKGDSKVFLIAAASIIAKVTRDRLMIKYSQEYPGYGFEQHKGYGTKLHLAKLKQVGPCAIHRKSFAPIKFIKDFNC